MKFDSKSKLFASLFAICFIVYQTVFFVICGFSDHEAGFWISWVFMLIAFASLAFAGILLGKKGMLLRDWLFGFPIIKHSTVYITAELLVSTLFVILDATIKTSIVFAVQFVMLGIYLVFAISCLLAKEAIDDIHTKVNDKTAYIKLLQVDADMLCEKGTDPAAAKVFRSFSDQVRYSDVMSNEVLFELEKEISLAIDTANRFLDQGDTANAVQCCQRASMLLTERNKKTKALK